MSAFIVEPETINNIVTHLNLHAGDYRHTFRNSGYDLNQYDDLQRLAEDLYDLNCAAVQARYGEAIESRDAQGRSLHRFTILGKAPSDIQAYKSTFCLRYQCSEGDITERPLYHVLTRLYHAMAHRLVTRLPEYHQAVWDQKPTAAQFAF